eukprot:750010-Hanusia_phi.AAC.2
MSSIVAIDPDQSASSGLTNEVAGRLAFFDRDEEQNDNASAQPTPNKENPCKDRRFDSSGDEGDDDGDVENHKLEQFLIELKGCGELEKKSRVGNALYQEIYSLHPDLAGKLTGMFLEATEDLDRLAFLIFSQSALQLHLSQALSVLNSAQPIIPEAEVVSPSVEKKMQARTPSSPREVEENVLIDRDC